MCRERVAKRKIQALCFGVEYDEKDALHVASSFSRGTAPFTGSLAASNSGRLTGQA